MPSLLPGYEYDIFISYRQKDNRSDQWVTNFVHALREELDATFKEEISIYFDSNPHDGLLETHDVDGSLKEKIKCLIFIPIVSQTYCDPKSFAWQKEFIAFVDFAKDDQYGLDVKLPNGNVAKRVLPVRIHELDQADKKLFEEAIGGVMRPVDFIYKEPGVNRPLQISDNRNDNQNHTDYKNQVNKVANAIKELAHTLQRKSTMVNAPLRSGKPARKRSPILMGLGVLALLTLGILYYSKSNNQNIDPFQEQLDKVEKNLEEMGRFDDHRYFVSSLSLLRNILSKDSIHERALALTARIWSSQEGHDSATYYVTKLFKHHPQTKHGLYARAELNASSLKRNYKLAINDYLTLHKNDPEDEKIIESLANLYLEDQQFEKCFEFVKLYQYQTGKRLYEVLSQLYLVLGDFKSSLYYLTLRDQSKEFSCYNVEEYQRLYLCSGDFGKLSQLTDSICAVMDCPTCPYWRMRAHLHEGKMGVAESLSHAAIKSIGGLAWKYPAYVLLKSGKTDSARLIANRELEMVNKFIADTSYHLSLPYYSKSAIAAMWGDYKESIKWLRVYAEKGFVWGSEWYIMRDPLFDGLKADPKYFPEFMQIVHREQAYKMNIREKIRELETKR